MDEQKSKEDKERLLKRHEEALAAFEKQLILAGEKYRLRIKQIERQEFMMRAIVVALAFATIAITLFVNVRQKPTIKSGVFNLGENEKPSNQSNDSADHRPNERADRVQEKQDDGSHLEE